MNQEETNSLSSMKPVVESHSYIASEQQYYEKGVNLHIVSSLEDCPCKLWIGLSKFSDKNVAEILTMKDLGELLTSCASTGVNLTKPLMLADASQELPYFIYLTPTPEAMELQPKVWSKTLFETLNSWPHDGLGLYFSPELENEEKSLKLLTYTLQFFLTNNVRSNYYLYVGEHYFNAVLEVALQIKGQFQDLWLYH